MNLAPFPCDVPGCQNFMDEYVDGVALCREHFGTRQVFRADLAASACGPFTPYPRIHMRVMADELRVKEIVG